MILAWERTLAGGTSPMARYPQTQALSVTSCTREGLRAKAQGGAVKPRVSLTSFVRVPPPGRPDAPAVPGPALLLTC